MRADGLGAGHGGEVSGARNGKGPVGVVLFQLGGPDSLEAVEPFLFNLFSDPDIIDFPLARLARPAMARLIASRRAQKVRANYARMGGKSPLRELTERQARALERELRNYLDARVVVAMRYWHPLTEEAVRKVIEFSARELVLLPLYPQYSRTTTGSSLNEWKRQFGRNHTQIHLIREFHDHPLYLDAVVEKINEGLARFSSEVPSSKSAAHSAEDVHLVFSAHGVPCDVIEAGDPYQRQIEETVRLVMARGGWPNPHDVCYQSRVGSGRWLGPTLEEMIRRLAEKVDARFRGHDSELDDHSRALVNPAKPVLREGGGAGIRSEGSSGSPPFHLKQRSDPRILVIPISFVSDHVETLSEIDFKARALAGSLGVGQFELIPALNDSPRFIQALADLVLGQLGHGGAV